MHASPPPSIPDSVPQVQVAGRVAVVADVQGICQFAQADMDPAYTPSAVYLGYASYLQDILPKDLSGVDAGPGRTADQLAWFENWQKSIRVTVVSAPRHGRMIVDDKIDRRQPSYFPNKGFVGKDRVDVLVSAKDGKGRLVTRKLVYFINVLPGETFEKLADNHRPMVKRHCGKDAPVWPVRE